MFEDRFGNGLGYSSVMRDDDDDDDDDDDQHTHATIVVTKEPKAKLDRPRFGRTIEVEGSDLVSSVEYDPETLVLDAKLTSGDRYRYRGISPTIFARFITAKSPGQAFNRFMKTRSFQRLPRSK